MMGKLLIGVRGSVVVAHKNALLDNEDIEIVEKDTLTKARKVGEFMRFNNLLKRSKLSKKDIAEIYEESIKDNPELADAYKEIEKRNV